MGLGHSPRIVTDGLVLCLDAANKRSYPGTGTTWTDRSANGYTGTLRNIPDSDFTSDGGGSFFLDGSDEDIVVSSTEAARIGTGDHTISAWVKNLANSEEDFIGTGGASQGDVLLMVFSYAGGGNGGFRGHAWSSNGSSNTIDSPNAIGTGNWNYLTQRVAWGGNIDLFENGVLVKTQTLSGSAPTSSRTSVILGARSSGNRATFYGNFAATHFYNRALSAKEILQNYEATKGRYE